MTENSWHKNNKTWKKINEFLFKNETMSDCAFLVQDGNTTVKIPAHKYVLGGYSPEFYNLFYLLKSDSDEIPINDVSGEDFIKFLEFVYTETTEINLDNVDVLIMLAVRYSVESFKDFCGHFLQKSVTGENVLTLMDKYSAHDLPNFELECLKIISKNRLIFEDPLLNDISNNTLTTIIRSKELIGFKEITIFKGADKWSEEFCKKNNRLINTENKRLALGEALKYIRFGAMTCEEFSLCTLNVQNSVLTALEIINIFQYIGMNGQTNCPYSGEKRLSDEIQICNFTKGGTTKYQKYNFEIKGYDCLSFTVNKPIQFHGFGILGRVDLLNLQNPEKMIIKLKDKNGTIFRNDIVKINHDGTDKIYELFFDNSKLLDANKEYVIYIQRQQPGTFLNYYLNEDNIYKTMNVDGVVFNIKLSYNASYNFSASLLFKKQ